MQQYDVTGMSCAACQAHVEKAVSKVPGVESCSVSLLTNSMGVEGTADASDIIKAVEDAGYGASLRAEPGAGSAGGAGDNAGNTAGGKAGNAASGAAGSGSGASDRAYDPYAAEKEASVLIPRMR